MAIPPEFNEVELLQSTIRRYVNRQVKEDFKDLGGDNWEPEVNTTRGAMQHVLTHKDNDSLVMSLNRLFLYYFTYGAAKAMQPDIFGSPIVTTDRPRRYHPQITLHFSNKGYNPTQKHELVEGECSFRLMNETATTITKAELERFAIKIKSLFATPTKFVWHKGKTLISYTDWDKGYQFQLLVTNEAEAKRIVEQVLDIQGHTPEWSKLGINNNSDPNTAYPNAPGNQVILGESVEKVKRRPIENVIFRYATINIHSKGRGINLVDTTFTRANALERAA
jgi:hypothetical protein